MQPAEDQHVLGVLKVMLDLLKRQELATCLPFLHGELFSRKETSLKPYPILLLFQHLVSSCRNIQETEIKKIVERRNLNNKKEEKPYVNLKIDPV